MSIDLHSPTLFMSAIIQPDLSEKGPYPRH